MSTSNQRLASVSPRKAESIAEPCAAFDAPGFNREIHGLAWRLLGRRLKRLRARHGLSAALQALHQQQRDVGFIQDALDQVDTRRVLAPAQRSFSIQFNARRALRLKGAGRTLPPDGSVAQHGGCFLDRGNVQWQQSGIELGMDIGVNGRAYVAWANPFPLKPLHLTIALAEHVPQSWVGANLDATTARLHLLLVDLLDLLAGCPGFIGFHNGVGAGASIAGHFHFQLFRRELTDERFPLELAAAQRQTDAPTDSLTAAPLVLSGDAYPVVAACFSGTRDRVVAQALAWASAWAEFNGNSAATTGNFIATAVPGVADLFELYFVPRLAAAQAAGGLAPSSVGSLELLGEYVLSDADQHQALLAGRIDFEQVWHTLRAVQPPGIAAFVLWARARV